MRRSSNSRFSLLMTLVAFSGLFGALAFSVGCRSAMVGPDFEEPPATVAKSWAESGEGAIKPEPVDDRQWWTVFNDPVLNDLIELAYNQNLTLQIAGLKVMEARAQLGLAGGSLYPQVQQVNAGYAYNYVPAAGGSFGSASFGFDTSWELDIWGKYRRGIESADANLFANVASYDDVLVSLTAEVARTYVLIRTTEARIKTARQNITIQTRALEITRTLNEGGTQSELDVQQAATTLYNTQSSVPALQISLRQAAHSLSILLGMPPEKLPTILNGSGEIPSAPTAVAVGVPADLLRRRPDIRQAEFQAAAQSAQIGVARADFYPSVALVGTVGWSASNAGGASLGDLFSASTFGADVGPTVNWNIFNYGRIRNNVRVQDARFQQLMVNYQSVVLSAAGEVEDAMVAFLRSQEQAGYLKQSVDSSKRALDLSVLQYKEGIVDYQRVLDSTRSLTQQQDQYIETMGNITINLVAMYKALGGGWQVRLGKPFVPEPTKEQMEERTNWGEMLDATNDGLPATVSTNLWRLPDW